MSSGIVPASGLMGPDGHDDRLETQPEKESKLVRLMSHGDASHAADDHEVFDKLRNKQPLEVYLYHAANERMREDQDPRPIPDAPWVVLIKRLTGRKDQIVTPYTPAVPGAQPHLSTRGPGSPWHERLSDRVERIGLPAATVRARRGYRDGEQMAGDPPQTHAPGHGIAKGKSEKGEHEHEVTVGAPLSDNGSHSHASERHESDAELNANIQGQKETAYRLVRVASWQIVFYLITTDILGFSSAPQAFQSLGIVPGVLVFTFFFFLAFLSGQILWRLYLHLDSEQFPITCYADIGERTFGTVVRHIFNILQSLQLLFNVAILIVGQGQTLASIIEFKFCYVALNIFFAVAGLIIGQIKSLRNFAWFTNVNIWLNIIIMVLTIIGFNLYAPVPAQSFHKDLSEPIQISAWVPSYTKGWYQQVSGVQLAVFAYGGAMIFTEFMSEMRRPRDFWKSAFLSQLFCYLMYMFFGLFDYCIQGQYTAIMPYLNFANQALSLVTNIISLVSTGVATVLYANIGVKVFYQNVLREYCHAPPLMSRKGSAWWSISVIGYWALAWVIGSAIPNITALVTLIGAACILQFTYTFPPLLLLGFWMQTDASKGDRPWEVGMEPFSNRVDTWRDMSRWKRGLRRYWYVKTFLFLLFLAALALAGLGIYSGIETAIQQYGTTGATTAFSCKAPGQP